MLKKDKLVKTYKNLRLYATKVLKVKYGLSHQITNNVFEIKCVLYNMRKQNLF